MQQCPEVIICGMRNQDMTGIFQLIEIKNDQGISEKSLSLGIQVRVGDHMNILPITAECRSVGALVREVKALQEELEDTLEKGKALFAGKSSGTGMEITDDMAPEQVWSVLSAIVGEEAFVGSFNSMPEEQRRVVAEYILTSCNIFAGKAAVFSARYDGDTALLE